MIEQEFACMTIPDWFKQSLKIFVVEIRESFSRGAEGREGCIVQRSDVFATQDTLAEQAEAIAGVMVSRN